jgi:hypothetical protein
MTRRRRFYRRVENTEPGKRCQPLPSKLGPTGPTLLSGWAPRAGCCHHRTVPLFLSRAEELRALVGQVRIVYERDDELPALAEDASRSAGDAVLFGLETIGIPRSPWIGCAVELAGTSWKSKERRSAR